MVSQVKLCPQFCYFIIVNSGVVWGGVCVRGGVGCLGGGGGGLAFPLGGRKCPENTQKSQKSHKIQAPPLIKNLSEKWGGAGWGL